VILRELVVHNFGVFRGRTTLTLAPPDSDGAGPICLIGALNGAGKTTLLDAMLLALYGNRARCSTRNGVSYPEFLRSCRHRNAPDREGAGVELEFECSIAGEALCLRVVRSWRGGGTRPSESVRVLRNGEYDPGWTDTWSERIEDLVPLGISNLFFFDGEQVRTLAATGHPIADVRSAIESLIGLELPARLRSDLTIVARRVQRRLADLAGDPAPQELVEDVGRLQSELKRQEATCSGLREDVEAASAEVNALQEAFTAEGGELARRREEMRRELAGVRERRQARRVRMTELASSCLPLATIRPLLERTLARARAEQTYLDAERVRELLDERDDRLLVHAGDLGLAARQVRSIEGFLEADRRRRRCSLEGTPYLGLTDQDVARVEQVARRELPEAVSAAQQEIEALQADDEVEQALEAKLDATAAPEVCEERGTKLKSAQDRLADLHRQVGAAEARAERTRSELLRLEREMARQLRRAAEAADQQRTETRVLAAAGRADSALARYGERVRRSKLDMLERLATERFRHLAHKKDLIGRVCIDPGSFGLSLQDPAGRPVEHQRLAAGEQQILAVAFLWALGTTSGRAIPMVIDTPLSRMDGEHRRRIVEGYLPHASHQVVLLSTDAEIDRDQYAVLTGLRAIDRSYVLRYRPAEARSVVQDGYFWPEDR